MRVKITLACTECKQRNYNTKKNKKNSPDRLEMKSIAASAKSILCIARPSKKGGRTWLKQAAKARLFTKVKNWFKGIGKYFRDTRSELKRWCGPAKSRSSTTPDRC